jgi:uncharacterized repeat protein (TIGR01451 family)
MGDVASERGTRTRARGRAVAAVCALVFACAGVALAAGSTADPKGHTTLEQVLVGGNPDDGYQTLSVDTQSPDPLVLRDQAQVGTDDVPVAQPGREQRRRSLSYFSQMTDFQLADEESPARVEFTDNDPTGTAKSAWRPQEALIPFEVNASIEQINAFAAASPFPQGNGTRNSMDFSLATGDQADNMQRNENVWVRDLLEGNGPLNFNSGGPVTNPLLPGCALPTVPGPAEAARYTGVQDYDDYLNLTNFFYDPDNPRGSWKTKPPFSPPGAAAGGWPTYTGLMDRAQMLSITPAGLDNPATATPDDLPFYVTNGNHDTLVQGNQAANAAFEQLATGCLKPLASTSPPVLNPDDPDSLDPNVLLNGVTTTMSVPPDPNRRFAAKPQVKAIYSQHGEDNGHGFGFVDSTEDTASNGSASYYAWNPPEAPGFRFINIDTNAEGGVAGPGSSGNIDDPQFQWLRGELEAAQAKDQLIAVWGHHPVRSMDADLPDEAAPPCTGQQTSYGDSPEHDLNPGCDIDQRNSAPVHLGNEGGQAGSESFVQLLDHYPNVIAYVPGHTHQNAIRPRGIDTPEQAGLTGRVWWEINTSAVADWPTQSRLIDVMDNRDQTLSIFTALIDHAGMAQTPASGIPACGATPTCSDADGFDADQLASIGRTFAYNDPEEGPDGDQGADSDRDAELLVFDPREADLSVSKSDSPDPVQVAKALTYTVQVRNNDPLSDQSGATGVSLTDQLPASVQFVSATSSTGSCQTPKSGAHGGSVSCALGDLASQASATVTIKVKPQTVGSISNLASVDGILPDPVAANDSATQATTVTAAPRG